MSDRAELQRLQLAVHELEAKLAVSEITLRSERAMAEANVAACEQMLAAERERWATVEQSQADHRRAIEDAYQARIRVLRDELELWRRGDHEALLRFLAARARSIDASLAGIEGSGEAVSESMRALADRLRAERADIETIQARLSVAGR
ncbi:MAG TPA: hypothetical protein VK034_18445 [Enhygromyxa sp.]|nr:hypothetical protein [Enhygromyxa sp.]